MELCEFQPGDRVQYCGRYSHLCHKYGTVVGIMPDFLVVDFDEPFQSGHDGFVDYGTPLCRDGHGWYVRLSEAKLIAYAELDCEDADLGSLMELLN